MPGGERHAEVHRTVAPLALGGEQAVREFAERAVGATQSGTDPVRHLSDDGAVGVVHADELVNRGAHGHDGRSRVVIWVRQKTENGRFLVPFRSRGPVE